MNKKNYHQLGTVPSPFVQAQGPRSTATLDMDATLVETNKSDALYCYQGFRSYPTMQIRGKRYKVFGIVTNMDWDGQGLINLPGRVLERSRSLIIRLTKGHPSFALLVEARRKIAMLMPAPGG